MQFYKHFNEQNVRFIRVLCSQEYIPLIAIVGSKSFYRALPSGLRVDGPAERRTHARFVMTENSATI